MAEVQKQFSFVANFCEAYSFRNLIEYLKAFHSEIDFVFKKDGIYILRSNAKQDLINEVWINARELTYYEYNEDEEMFVRGVDTASLKTAVQLIGKKDSARFSMLKNDDSFRLQIMGFNNKDFDGNVNKIKTKAIERQEIELNDYKRSLSEQNFVVPLADFAKSCKPMSSQCNFVYLSQFPRGAKIEKITNGVSGELVNKFGIIDEKVLNSSDEKTGPKLVIRQDDIKRIKIRSENIKNLAKTNNMSGSSNMRFYFENEIIIRLNCNIGCYGSLTVHMVDADSVSASD